MNVIMIKSDFKHLLKHLHQIESQLENGLKIYLNSVFSPTEVRPTNKKEQKTIKQQMSYELL